MKKLCLKVSLISFLFLNSASAQELNFSCSQPKIQLPDYMSENMDDETKVYMEMENAEILERLKENHKDTLSVVVDDTYASAKVFYPVEFHGTQTEQTLFVCNQENGLKTTLDCVRAETDEPQEHFQYNAEGDIYFENIVWGFIATRYTCTLN